MKFFKSKLNLHITELSLPVFFGMLSHTLIQVSDTIMVGKLGSEAIASAGLGGIAYFTILSFLMNGSVGIQILTARRYGEKNEIEIGKIGISVLYFSLVAGFVFSVLGYYLSHWVIALISNDPNIIQSASSYLAYRFLGTIFFFPIFALRGFMDGLGHTYLGMIAAFSSTFSNIFMNWVLIYGNLGFTALGVDGAAIASALSGIPAMLILVVYLFKKDIAYYLKQSHFQFDFLVLKNAISIGLPSAIDGSLTNIAFMVFNKFAGMIGIDALAASQIIISIISLSFMPGFAFGVAATTILGQAMGAGKFQLARLGTFRSAKFSAVLMGIMGILFIVFGKQIIGLFSAELPVIREAYPALIVISIVQVGDAYHMVFGSALRSAGLVVWVLQVYAVISYLVMLPLAYLFGVYLRLGSLGLWSAVSIWLVCLSLCFVWKFNQGDWKHRKI
ncbi:MAG TPA: MATE family efflux transporter [Leptospiraceae bacterium]|nr:MATE family efflux transporter [Leptospiraceae bacterium]HRG76970.1 MATE family efflux transporter [Leptospiraceae bacterium]